MNPKNIFWNLLGLGLPLIIAALTVPHLIATVGVERFGFLALSWGLIGYAGILDLGIGRVVTQKLSSIRGSDEEMNSYTIMSTAIRITTIVGGLGFSLIIMFGLLGGGEFFPHKDVSSLELEFSVLLLAFALPLQAISATYRGVNEAYLNFKGINLLRIFLGATNFGGPFLVSFYVKDLHYLVITLVLSRVLAFFVFRRLAHGALKETLVERSCKYDRRQAVELFRFGGWVTISSIINPFLVQSDRFFIGVLLSAAAVTSYVIPYEITIQSMILVGAVSTVAFPSISNLIRTSFAEALECFNKWLLRVLLIMGGGMLCLAFLLPFILKLWVGNYIGDDSISVGRILCLGVFFNALGAMFYSFLHANAKVKETAILHSIELPIFILILIILIPRHGIVGAAVAWSLRTLADTIVLAVLSYFSGWRVKFANC
ncbi:TPA: oligosaccharide flippase family protein [Pseudomonas aeruginosa]